MATGSVDLSVVVSILGHYRLGDALRRAFCTGLVQLSPAVVSCITPWQLEAGSTVQLGSTPATTISDLLLQKEPVHFSRSD